MKSVLISIQPKWCELIANGGKTIEVRKTKPKIETPFKCYIYCTQSMTHLYKFSKEISEATGFEGLYTTQHNKASLVPSGFLNGKVIGEFICDKLVWVVSHPTIFAGHDLFHQKAIDDACLTNAEVEKYSSGKDVYGWHISDLVIYDKPKELSEFFISCGDNPKCDGCEMRYYTYCRSIIDGHRPLTRPPQSWCYVEGKEDNWK